eukprot:gene28325-35162_t
MGYDDPFDMLWKDNYDPTHHHRQPEANYTTREMRNLAMWRDNIAQTMWDSYVAYGQQAQPDDRL